MQNTQSHTETIRPPLQFKRPFGADTALSERLRMRSLEPGTQGRARTPQLPNGIISPPGTTREPCPTTVHDRSMSPPIPPPISHPIGSFAMPGAGSHGSSSSSSGHSNSASTQPPRGATVSSHSVPSDIPANGPTTSGVEEVGAQLNYLISEVKHIRREMEERQRRRDSTSPQRSKVRGYGEFKANTPSRIRSSARTEMMVSTVARIYHYLAHIIFVECCTR